MEMAYYPKYNKCYGFSSSCLEDLVRRPSFPDIDFQIALVPSHQIEPQKAIGLSRESL